MQLSCAHIAAHGQKKLAGPNYYGFSYCCCAACLRAAMRENIGSVGAMRERDYFGALQSPFNAGAFCRLEPDLFHKTRLAQSCR